MQRSQFRIHLELHYGNPILVLLLVEIPPSTHNHRTLINCSTNVLVNEVHFVDLGIELMVQNQLVLDSSITIFPGHRTDIEQILRTEEGITQCTVSPLSLFANKLGNNLGTSTLDLGFTSYIQVIQPFIYFSDLTVMDWLCILQILLQFR